MSGDPESNTDCDDPSVQPTAGAEKVTSKVSVKDDNAASSPPENETKDTPKSDLLTSNEHEKAGDGTSSDTDVASGDLPANADRVYNPRPADILLGRGKPFQSHNGNQWMLKMVDKYREQYVKAQRTEKHSIIEDILKQIKSNGGRFLLRVDYEQYWIEVDKTVSYRKVGHAFRSKARSSSKGEPKEAEDRPTSEEKAAESNNKGAIKDPETSPGGHRGDRVPADSRTFLTGSSQQTPSATLNLPMPTSVINPQLISQHRIHMMRMMSNRDLLMARSSMPLFHAGIYRPGLNSGMVFPSAMGSYSLPRLPSSGPMMMQRHPQFASRMMSPGLVGHPNMFGPGSLSGNLHHNPIPPSLRMDTGATRQDLFQLHSSFDHPRLLGSRNAMVESSSAAESRLEFSSPTTAGTTPRQETPADEQKQNTEEQKQSSTPRKEKRVRKKGTKAKTSKAK